METHENIKALREQQGLSQESLAEKVGYKDRSSIAKIEAGLVDLPQSKIAAFAKVLHVTPAYLMGMEEEPPFASNKIPTPSLPDEALKVAKDYTELDQPGKNVVKVVLAEEGKRVKAEKERRSLAPAEPRETRFIPLYFTPAAAGMTEPAAGDDFDYIEAGPEVPVKADCAIKISGDSMEPYIMDKSIVYVTREPLENGDVGIFCVDGDMLCKQYYKDGNGNVRLLSLNRARSDADRFIHRDSDTLMTYYGRVILPRRPGVSWACF